MDGIASSPQVSEELDDVRAKRRAIEKLEAVEARAARHDHEGSLAWTHLADLARLHGLLFERIAELDEATAPVQTPHRDPQGGGREEADHQEASPLVEELRQRLAGAEAMIRRVEGILSRLEV